MMNRLQLDFGVCKCATMTGGSVQGDDLHQFVLENDARAILNVRFTEDVHVPNGDGQFALVTAVRTGNLEIAKLLLAHRVAASIFEPVAKTNAIVAAFGYGDAEMSRLLLQFGANPDIEDDDGNTARSVAPYCSEFLEILSEYDAGALYVNKETLEKTKETPPSCAWRKNAIQGHTFFQNAVTGQTTWRRPNALAWRKLLDEKSGMEFWYNYRTNRWSKKQGPFGTTVLQVSAAGRIQTSANVGGNVTWKDMGFHTTGAES
ncbi:hypothetical protein BSKO_02587 [Bryopsis sp. KO-2023]|nr:hypothetical protein BSKO_02587 [Bryopsis sp. KO-2023]